MRVKVLGSPGCGKSTYLLEQAKQFVEAGIENIVLTSFTTAASDVLNKRLKTMGMHNRVKAATLHSLAFDHMRIKKTYMVNTLHAFAKSLGEKCSLTNDRNTYAALTPLERSISFYQIQRSLMVSDTTIPSGLSIETVQAYITAFELYKEKNNFLDFNDVLIRYINDGEPLDFEVALLDESQDNSTLNWAALEKMFCNSQYLYAVGDPRQSIYGFAGVRPESFSEWPCDEERTLQHTYRYGKDIQKYSQRVLDRIPYHTYKKCVPTDKSSKVTFTNGIIPKLDILPYNSVAILHRNRYLVQKTQAMMDNLGLTYSGTGSPFVSQGQMKAIRRWEEWRRGAELEVYHVHSIAKYVPRSYVFDRMEEKGKRSLAGPCPYPNRPWYEILTLKYENIYRNVQNMHGYEYLITTPTTTVTTIHQSKGGEWAKVIVIPDMSAATYLEYKLGVDTGSEHRVWFVALTRAVEHLQIVKPTTPKFYPLEELHQN